MSGGAYGYSYEKVHDFADAIITYGQEPLRHALKDHLLKISKVMQAVEWADSGDTSWDDELEKQIREIVSPYCELKALLMLSQEAKHGLDVAIKRAEQEMEAKR